MSDNHQDPAVKSRKPQAPSKRLGHKKSRNGCTRCKERHVKCDEKRPCRNCVRFDLTCSLVQDLGTSPAPTSPKQSISSPRSPTTVPVPSSPDVSADAGTDRNAPTWMQSLKLLHHYTSVVVDTLSNNAVGKDLWSDTVLEVAFANEFLMHGLLSLSALHYAQRHPPERREYLLISSHYQSLAIQEFTARLSTINEDNFEPFFFLATFVFIQSMCSIADPHKPGDTVTPGEIAHSFGLLQGIKSILAFKPMETWARDGPLKPLIIPLDPVIETQSGPFQDRMEELYAVARTLTPTVETINVQSSCLLAIESLRTTHSLCVTADQIDQARHMWLWPSTLTTLFVDLIGNSHPVALIILAHYAALVRRFEQPHWMNRGWSRSIMMAVEHALDEKWTQWIEWPRKSLYEEIDVDQMKG